MSARQAAIAGGRAWIERTLGGPEKQLKSAERLARVSGAVVVACTLLLIGDYAIGMWSGAGQGTRIVELEGQTKEDAEVAAVLHEERKDQTDASLARETRGRTLAWVLLLAGAAFVGSGKWWVSLRPERHPSLEELVAVRLGLPSPGVGGAQGAESGKQPRGESEGNVAPEATGHDDRFGRDQPEEEYQEFVDDLINRFGRGRESAIPILQAIQGRYRYLPDEALQYVCERTDITPAQIAGTSSFYSQFRRSPVGQHVVKVCHGTACHVAGADQITEELRRHLEIPPDADTDDQRLFTVDKVACLGCCSLAPVMMIEEDTAGRLTPATARQALDAVAKRSTS